MQGVQPLGKETEEVGVLQQQGEFALQLRP